MLCEWSSNGYILRKPVGTNIIRSNKSLQHILNCYLEMDTRRILMKIIFKAYYSNR